MITPLVLAFTPNYLVPACTTLLSVLHNSDKESRYHVICLLTEDLSAELQQQLISFGGTRLAFTFMNLTGKLDGIYVDDRYTIAASFRLLLPYLLPEYEKVIYLDCDIIVQNDLSQLYRQIEFGDNYIAGVFEAPLAFQIDYWKKIGTDPGYYMNSGFLVMNLSLLRQDNMVDKFIEASKVDYLQFPDQDVLNQVCKGRILGLEPYNNAIRTFYLPQYKEEFLQRYTLSEWDDVQQKGNIHYTGGKPWNGYTIQFAAWWKYFFMLPKDIKQGFQISSKLVYLGKVTNTAVGQVLLNGLQWVYRKRKTK